jgi:TetR/AcrR family transcriptional regulator, transcriptional repressor for nem operon
VRKSREEAAQTRKNIVSAAAAEFREKGIGATGLAALMKAAGLTHGGFYKHFESKDQLVAEAFAEALEALLQKLTDAGPGAVATYLSDWHRDNPAEGCPLTSIGSELARTDEKTRGLATDGFRQLVDLIAGRFDLTPAAARSRAMAAVSTMIGAVTMARIVDDPKLSAEILKEAKKSLAEK